MCTHEEKYFFLQWPINLKPAFSVTAKHMSSLIYHKPAYVFCGLRLNIYK